MRELFTYYRVQPNHAGPLREAVRDWHRRLIERHPELIVQLLQRRQAPLDTWMEIFRTDPTLAPGGVSDELQALIENEALALAALIDGPRHTEVFHACAS